MDEIYLRPAHSFQGEHEVLNLSIGKMNTCMRVRLCEITDLVIQAVEKLAEPQGFRSLKFFNRKNEADLFLDSDLITGVDTHNYNDQDINDNESENEDDPEDSEDDDSEDEY